MRSQIKVNNRKNSEYNNKIKNDISNKKILLRTYTFWVVKTSAELDDEIAQPCLSTWVVYVIGWVDI